MNASPSVAVLLSLDQCVSAFLPVEQVAGPYLARQDVADDTRGHKRRNLRRVVGRRALDDFHPGQRLRVRDDLEKLQHFTRRKAPILQNVMEILYCERCPRRQDCSCLMKV